MAAASRHTLGVISNARRIVGADDEIASANATTALATQSRECDETALASATIDMQVARSNRDVAQRVLAEQSRRIAQTTDKCVKMDGMIEVFNREVAESERLISMCELQVSLRVTNNKTAWSSKVTAPITTSELRPTGN